MSQEQLKTFKVINSFAVDDAAGDVVGLYMTRNECLFGYLELAVQQVRNTFEIEYGSSIEEFLDSIYLAGADIGGSKLEDYAKSIERSNKMLTLLNSAVDILRSKHKHGEQYYWILYYGYLSPQQLQNTDEIIESLRSHIANISTRTYYRKQALIII